MSQYLVLSIAATTEACGVTLKVSISQRASARLAHLEGSLDSEFVVAAVSSVDAPNIGVCAWTEAMVVVFMSVANA